MPYSEQRRKEIIDYVCSEMENGRSLRSILKDPDMPVMNTFYDWIDDNKELMKQYARACEARTDYYADEIIEIADTQNADAYVEPESGRTVIDGQAIQRSKLMVDTRRWLMGKLQPKKYGDAALIKLGNPDGEELKLNAVFSYDPLRADDGPEEDSASKETD